MTDRVQRRANLRGRTVLAALGAAFVALTACAEPYRDGDVVVFFGDSITHGGRYHAYIADYYRTRYPDARIRFINSGISGDTAGGAFKRIADDVTEYEPTHVAFHFGMNDVGRESYNPETTPWNLRGRDYGQRRFRRNFQGLVQTVRKAVPRAKFTYLTPTVYDDRAVLTNAPSWVVNQVGANLALSILAGFAFECARVDKAEAVDWYSPLNNFQLRHQAKDPHFTITVGDRVHPGEMGHSIMAWAFLKAQCATSLVSEVEIDAAGARLVRSENGAVSNLGSGTDGVTFTHLAKSLPMPVHEKALPYVGEFKVEDELNREVVKVTGLPKAEYALTIDGEEVGRYTSAQFAAGVKLGFNAKTPQYRQAQEVAKRDEELRQRERVLRDYNAVRCVYRDKAPVDDVPAFRAWYEKDVASGGKVAKSYFGQFIPGYLENWTKYKELRAALWKDQDAVSELAKPAPHKYAIARVKRP